MRFGVAMTGRAAGARTPPCRVMLTIGVGVLLAALTGCAVDPESARRSGDYTAAREVATTLQSLLVKQLAAAGFRSRPYMFGTSRSNTALLHVALLETDRSGATHRSGVGAGFANATLKTSVDLQNATSIGGDSLTAFNTSSGMGRESAKRTAAVIVAQIEHYYSSVGWDLPRA
jgi:Domain of unknown function (DUF4410)